MPKRQVIVIDEAKCNGCGECVRACAEGAIQLVDGKAKLVSDSYCDGLGACLGECPQDAIRLVEREAAAFDEAAVKAHLARPPRPAPKVTAACPGGNHHHAGGCPGSAMRAISRPASAPAGAAAPSELANWPVQLRLVPPNAPWFENADLVLAADCTAFACGGFHQQFLRQRPLVIACPKLDDPTGYLDKLATIICLNSVRSVTVIHMEVPCCLGLVRLATAAIRQAGRDVPLYTVTIGVNGDVLATVAPALAEV